jgi:hypothetical protein
MGAAEESPWEWGGYADAVPERFLDEWRDLGSRVFALYSEMRERAMAELSVASVSGLLLAVEGALSASGVADAAFGSLGGRLPRFAAGVTESQVARFAPWLVSGGDEEIRRLVAAFLSCWHRPGARLNLCDLDHFDHSEWLFGQPSPEELLLALASEGELPDEVAEVGATAVLQCLMILRYAIRQATGNADGTDSEDMAETVRRASEVRATKAEDAAREIADVCADYRQRLLGCRCASRRDFVAIIGPILDEIDSERECEGLVVILLNDGGRAVGALVRIGTRSSVTFSIDDVLAAAAKVGASKVVCAHSHPARSSAVPSDVDVQSAADVHFALEASDIRLADDLVLCRVDGGRDLKSVTATRRFADMVRAY